MNECCNFHELCKLWNAHFDTMIHCVTLLAAFFGFGVPAVTAWLQYKRFKYERERLDRDIERRLAEFEKQKELIARQNLRIGELQDLSNSAFVALANYYLDELMRFIVVFNDPTRTDERQQADMRKTISYFGKDLQCLVNSRNRGELVKILGTFAEPMSEIVTRDLELLKKVVNGLRQSDPQNNFFVTSENLAEITGPENSVYKKFVSAFQPLFELVDLYYSSDHKEKNV